MVMPAHPSSHALAFRKARRDSLLHPDPYQEEVKHAGNLVCTQCHVAYTAGHWQWSPPPLGAVPTLCPACRRVRDQYAAHVLRLDGVPSDRRQELLNLLFGVAGVERDEHPLERLMLVREDGDSIEAATTGMHIARRIVAKLLRRWRRELQVQHGPERTLLHWQHAG